MAQFSRPLAGAGAAASAAELMRRSPQRVTTTINWHLHQRLQAQADQQGRSLSNWISYLLERSLDSLP
jgi:predicted HicB family RNase H-like nuclease